MFKKTFLISLSLTVLIGSAVSASWKFVSMADSRGDTNGVNVAILSKIVTKINAESVDLVIFQGDAVNGTSDNTALASQLSTWVTEMNKLKCPYYATVGNHEISTATSEDVFRSKVNNPTNGPAGYAETVFSFDHNNAHFAFLNSDHYGEFHHVQRSWLATDLAANTQPHVFVSSHDPGYPSGPHSGDSLNLYASERDELWNIMGKAGVGMFFCGHEHLYQRTRQGNIIQVINGSCGAPLHTGYANTTAKYHYVVVTVDGNNVLSIAKDENGVEFDRWEYKLAPTCDSLRLMTDNAAMAIMKNKVVTHTVGTTAYVEEQDRSSAFQVSGAGVVVPGTALNIVGTLRTLATGEREINGSAVVLSTGNAVPKPVLISTKTLGGEQRGGNPYPAGGLGLNNYGMLVSIHGKVTSIGSGTDAGNFYLDDGAALLDGTSWNATPNVGVRVRASQTVAVGDRITVTGISSVFKNGASTCRLLYASVPVQPFLPFTAYNDVVANSPQPTPLANVTTYNTGPGPTSGFLKDFSTGAATTVTATMTQSGGVVHQPDLTSGGSETNAGTDAYNTFTALGVNVAGVEYYGATGWYVDLVFTGLDPTAFYEFTTTANRNGPTYADRLTKYTISGADPGYTNTSSSGAAGASTTLCTGYNTVNGYVARWTGIQSGSDGSFQVRAEAATSQNNAYAFSAFKLRQLP